MTEATVTTKDVPQSAAGDFVLRAKALAGLSRETYRRRLFAHLLRRGFSRGVALAAMKRVEG